MSNGADVPPVDAPAGDGADAAAWVRLERAAAAAADALAAWRQRAREAEAEVDRLRAVLDEVTEGAASAQGGEALKRLRAENAVLRSRNAEARARVAAILAKLDVVEGRR